MNSYRQIVKLDSAMFVSRLMPLLEQQLEVAIPVTGNSMYPLWKHSRDTVVLTRCDPYTLKKGDVVLYCRASGQAVLHRIIKVHRDSYDLCGDAQVELEWDIPKSSVLAVMCRYSRKGREYSTAQFIYRVYSALWIRLRPLRRVLRQGLRYGRKLVS